MTTQIKYSFLFYTFTLFMCINSIFLSNADAQDEQEPIVGPAGTNYIYETIEVPGVNILEVAASNDFGDYAGNTRSPDGKKTIGFTLIDGVFTTYDFPGSVNTYFFALDNVGKVAGFYIDADGLYHGVILHDGKLTQYDFPGATETLIFGLSDETGALSGNIVDADGITRAFSGDLVITFPGAVKTYGDFVNAAGVVVGSYEDADGMNHGFIRSPDGSFTTIDVPDATDLQFLFVNAINDNGVVIFRAKAVDDIPRSYILFSGGVPHELRVPGSVSTVIRNINQDGSIIGYYDTQDGRRLGFAAKPATPADRAKFGNTFSMHLTKGLNMLSVPLQPTIHMTARSLAVKTGATTVIALDAENQRFIGWTRSAPNDGFPIEGAKGYIINLREARNVVFTGTRWTHQTQGLASAPAISQTQGAWVFVVSGHLAGKRTYDGYRVIVRNLRTNSTITASVQGDYFAAATADLAQRSVVQVGDVIEVQVIGPYGNVESQTFSFKVTPENLANVDLSIRLDGIGKPNQDHLLQNYPNPFNPETWIPYQLSQDSPVSVSIYGTTGKLIRSLSLGFQSTGFYNSQDRAAYWDGKNELGEPVSSGVYFYTLTAGNFTATRRMLILK